ncbi:hypothetical protein DY000_02026430 [Brassica cretica]|uniref:Cyclin-dependent kinase inhibitor n=1 Tax=Brassica cretica TaxID=69181 RepID=A0ABQ7E5N3_BRACR|nr:hypothetical protein DY000_02026430 [Brassica cretica]
MAAGDVSVRGRRRERDVSEENGVVTPPPTVKRRKLEEEVNIESRIIFSPCVQATSCGGILARNSAGASETSVVFVRRRDSSVDEKCQIPSLVSCCSSNRSEEKTKRRIEFVDLVEDNGGDLDQTVTSWTYDNFNNTMRDTQHEDSTAMEVQEVECRRRLKMKKSPETVKEAELEDFFQAAEKDLRNNKMLECSWKYNFDFEKDEPLGGRYEWVKLNP